MEAYDVELSHSVCILFTKQRSHFSLLYRCREKYRQTLAHQLSSFLESRGAFLLLLCPPKTRIDPIPPVNTRGRDGRLSGSYIALHPDGVEVNLFYDIPSLTKLTIYFPVHIINLLGLGVKYLGYMSVCTNSGYRTEKEWRMLLDPNLDMTAEHYLARVNAMMDSSRRYQYLDQSHHNPSAQYISDNCEYNPSFARLAGSKRGAHRKPNAGGKRRRVYTFTLPGVLGSIGNSIHMPEPPPYCRQEVEAWLHAVDDCPVRYPQQTSATPEPCLNEDWFDLPDDEWCWHEVEDG